MTPTIIDCKCHFCSKPIRLDCGPHTHGIFDLTKWAKAMICDRCGEWRRASQRLEAVIVVECLNVASVRATTRDRDAVSKVEVRAEENLIALTKRYLKIQCDYFHLEQPWDAEFVNTLMDNPRSVSKVLATCRRGLAKAS